VIGIVLSILVTTFLHDALGLPPADGLAIAATGRLVPPPVGSEAHAAACT
jgi:hypothetical protein